MQHSSLQSSIFPHMPSMYQLSDVVFIVQEGWYEGLITDYSADKEEHWCAAPFWQLQCGYVLVLCTSVLSQHLSLLPL